MTKDMLELLSGEVLEEDLELTLAELCGACQLPAERVLELVEEGIVEAVGGVEPARWCFRGGSVRRVRFAVRVERDLGVNVADAALALDLLEELESLRIRLKCLGG